MKLVFHTRLYVALFLALFFFCNFFTLTASAQSLELGGTVFLETDPQIPPPNTEILVKLSAYTIDMNGASVRWFVDGTEVNAGAGGREISLKTGALGTRQSVRASVTSADGSTVSATKTIIPTELDIIIESAARVPDFYKGRSLPTGDEMVRATALLHNGATLNARDLTYTWRLGSTVLYGGPSRGAESVSFKMPKGNTILSVSVTDASGTVLSSRALQLRPAASELYFYEENPLRGMSTKAIMGSLDLVGDETSVRAEPYFMSPAIFGSDSRITWTLGGREIRNEQTEPNVLTLRAEGGSGSARVGFELINTKSLLQFVEKFFTINFESRI